MMVRADDVVGLRGFMKAGPRCTLTMNPVPDALESPVADGSFSLPATRFTSHVTGQSYVQPAYSTRYTTRLTLGSFSYSEALATLPQGYRMSALEEIARLTGRPRGVDTNMTPERVLSRDPLFAELFVRPQNWELTHAALYAANGASDFRTYTEKDGRGRTYYRADYFIGNCMVAEGVAIPQAFGGKVVEWNDALRLPAVTSDGEEPDHTTHFYFDESGQEVAVVLSGRRHFEEDRLCLDLVALYRRSSRLQRAALRLFESPLPELVLPRTD